MERKCFRCIFIEDCVESPKFLLFFSPLVLSKFEEWNNRPINPGSRMSNEENPSRKRANENEWDEEYDTGPFYKYIEKKLIQNNSNFEKTYKEIYLDLYLCEKCHGLHNIDIILFHKRDHAVFLKMQDSLTDLERKPLDAIFHMIELNMYKPMIGSVDIILFFLYLEKEKIYTHTKDDGASNESHTCSSTHKGKQKEGTPNVTLQLLNDTFNKINTYFVMHLNMEKNYIKRSIYTLFVFLLLYTYFTFYKRIFDAIDIEQSQLQILSKLFQHTKLIWAVELKAKSTNREREKAKEDEEEKERENEKGKRNKKTWHKRQWKKKRRFGYRNKKMKIISDEGENIMSTQENNKIPEVYDEQRTSVADIKENKKDIEIEEKTEERRDMLKNNDNNSFTRIKSIELYISFNKLCICGLYNKYNRNISQSRWVINQKKNSATSIEECVSEIFKPVFRFSSATFISSGREDKDVRMMNVGRPFVLILNETKFSLLNFFMFFDKLKELTDYNCCQVKTVPELQNVLYIPLDNKVAPYNEFLTHTEETKEEKEKSTGQTIDLHSTGKVSSPALFAFIWRKTSGLLYDVVNNKIVSEENKATIYEKKKIDTLCISTSYNKEMEELLCSNLDVTNWTMKSLNEENTPIVKKEYNIDDMVEVKLNNLVFTTDYKIIKKIMKYGERRKKSYKCLIYHTTPVDRKRIEDINTCISEYENKTENSKHEEITEEKSSAEKEQKEQKFGKGRTNEKKRDYILNIFQKTPVRVLHRRSLLKRERKIYEIKLVYVHPHCSLLYILSESGLYIKEFVNGDRGRTFPNLKYFFNGTYVNVLNLDVSKLVY